MRTPVHAVCADGQRVPASVASSRPGPGLCMPGIADELMILDKPVLTQPSLSSPLSPPDGSGVGARP
jgi:hypothetical protein